MDDLVAPPQVSSVGECDDHNQTVVTVNTDKQWSVKVWVDGTGQYKGTVVRLVELF